MRRTHVLMLSALVLGAIVSSCSTLNFVKRRLPPPTPSAEGMIFRFEAPSAKVVQLAGDWPENKWHAGQAQTGTFLVGEMKDEDGDGIRTRTEKLPAGPTPGPTPGPRTPDDSGARVTPGPSHASSASPRGPRPPRRRCARTATWRPRRRA